MRFVRTVLPETTSALSGKRRLPPSGRNHGRFGLKGNSPVRDGQRPSGSSIFPQVGSKSDLESQNPVLCSSPGFFIFKGFILLSFP